MFAVPTTKPAPVASHILPPQPARPTATATAAPVKKQAPPAPTPPPPVPQEPIPVAPAVTLPKVNIPSMVKGKRDFLFSVFDIFQKYE